MTTEAQQVLSSFARLSREEQLSVGKEIYKLVEAIADPFADVDFSPMEAEELSYFTRKQFAMYDEEEARRDGHA
jgi:hypothetical protein